MSRPKSLCHPALKRPPRSAWSKRARNPRSSAPEFRTSPSGLSQSSKLRQWPCTSTPPRSNPRVSSSAARCCGVPAPAAPVKRPPSGDARLGAPGAELHDAAEGVGAVGDRARAARDLDALERGGIEVGRARADAPLGGDARAVDEDERAAAGQPAHGGDGRVAFGDRGRAGHVLHRLRDVGGLAAADVVGGHDGDAAGRRRLDGRRAARDDHHRLLERGGRPRGSAARRQRLAPGWA